MGPEAVEFRSEGYTVDSCIEEGAENCVHYTEAFWFEVLWRLET